MTTEVSESIRLSARGRDIRVGDLYNYFTDEIFKSNRSLELYCIPAAEDVSKQQQITTEPSLKKDKVR